MNLFRLPSTEADAIMFLQQKGIAPSKRVCADGHEMTLKLGSQVRWRCLKRDCRSEVNLRVGNWLEGIRLPLVTVLRFIYGWCWEYTSVAWCERELQINHCTAVSMNAILRETCACWLLGQNEGKIGGQGLIVEVDETLFSKRKSNSGRVLPPQWVLGGLCRETGECFLVAVDDRSVITLMAAIADHVEPASTIYTDCWKGYSTKQLEAAGFQHFTVNHSYNFVDPLTGVHTQNIERMWGCLKWRNKRHRGTKRDFLESYFIEFMCRRRMGDDRFAWVLQAIASCFPPAESLLDDR